MLSASFFTYLLQQSSTDIWHAVCAAVKIACQTANVASGDVCGIGFAATCSLVAIDADDSPVTVSLTGDARRNVIVWMDHRATDQADRINAMHSPVLQFVGGALSPEMQPPKLLWVKENLKESWAVAFRWMDLSDWLTYRASGDDTRSLCTVVCKWTYLGHAHMEQMTSKDSTATAACGWDDVFWQEVGLEDLVEGNYAKIGQSVAFPGHPSGSGLTATAAKARTFSHAQLDLKLLCTSRSNFQKNFIYSLLKKSYSQAKLIGDNFFFGAFDEYTAGYFAIFVQELGLLEGTPVGTALIDAHAGGVGVMEGVPQSLDPANSDDPLRSRMVLVSGTSTCHMAVSKKKIFIPGVWGPYWSAMIPEYC
ncbi:hypothetical protein L7F22_025173 [Adiantum nelumboides]|nr:hypothetical protein [Adiantum nelumboides]